ncbi:MAG TPA: S8 family serine peptidase, partial [Pseudonocardia sp.]|nr:S8 family serine peptidase [Pseudonocardia sp.]
MRPAVPAPAVHDRSRHGTRMPHAAAVAAVLSLALLPGHALAQPAGPAECAEPSVDRTADVPWPQVALGYDRAWNLSEGAGTVVAVVDTGIDVDVPQLGDRVSIGPDLLGDGEGAGTDCAGRGTFLAGIVAGAPAPGMGFVGVAPEAGLVAV